MARTSSLCVVALLIGYAEGHASMTNPPPRTGMGMEYAGVCPGMWVPTPIGPAPRPSRGKSPVNGSCDWYNQGCQPGCSECNPKCGHVAAAFGLCCPKGKGKRMEPTVTDPKLRTFQDFGGVLDVGMKYNPWRSPGFAPVDDPCGIITGDQPGEHVDGAPKPGTRGSDMPPTKGPTWAAGSQQEVSWSLYANHGGGYSYRLCPKSSKLTEECFQKHHLQFVGDKSWIQYAGQDESNRTAIDATRVSEGTNPPGSQWTKNPIPACSGYVGGSSTPFNIPFLSNCKKPQFEPPLQDVIAPHPHLKPAPGLYGFGMGAVGPVESAEMFKYWQDIFSFNLIDKVQIPADLTPGDYVLSFRWDCEQTPQIWNNCADVTIAPPAIVV
jgi:hypothetical protein